MGQKKTKLRILTGEKVGLEFPANQLRLIIGRELTCNIVLDEPVLSRRHCVVSHEGDKYYISDLKSKNGTYLNGQRIDKQELEDGDLSLEESLKAFEEGMDLVKFCSKKLEEVEQKVTRLIKESEGKYSHQPFEIEDKEEA